MNKKNRKGFTIVELVIVIAVIGILATVLVPTFGNVIDKANAASAQQDAKNIYAAYVAQVDYANGAEATPDCYVFTGKYVVQIEDGAVTGTPVKEADFSLNTCYEKLVKGGTETTHVGATGCTHTAAN